MTTRLDDPVTVTTRPHWLGDPAVRIAGRLEAVTEHIPRFDRVPFGMNPRLDMIVRTAAAQGEIPIPTGVVSKRYALVQHVDVVSSIETALRAAGIEPAALQCCLTITESGARMALRVELPEEF